MPHLVLVDGSGFIFRAFHALPMMTRPDGTPVNAVFGFANMLARLLRDRCAAGEREVRWDAAGARSGLYFARLSVNGQVRTTRVVLRLGR